MSSVHRRVSQILQVPHCVVWWRVAYVWRQRSSSVDRVCLIDADSAAGAEAERVRRLDGSMQHAIVAVLCGYLVVLGKTGGLYQFQVEQRLWLNWSSTLQQHDAPSARELARKFHLACTNSHLTVIVLTRVVSNVGDVAHSITERKSPAVHTLNAECSNECARTCAGPFITLP